MLMFTALVMAAQEQFTKRFEQIQNELPRGHILRDKEAGVFVYATYNENSVFQGLSVGVGFKNHRINASVEYVGFEDLETTLSDLREFILGLSEGSLNLFVTFANDLESTANSTAE